MFVTFRPGIDFQGLNPVVTVTHAQTGNVLARDIPMTETAPGNYSSVISIAPENEVVAPPPPGVYTPPTPPITRTPPVEVLVDAGSTVEIDKRYASATNVMHPHEAILNQIRQNPIIDNVGTPSQVSRCPYCFSHLDGDENDNVLIIWDDDPTKVKGTQVMSIYKGFMQVKTKHIVDIQDNRKDIEANLDISPATEFTSLNNSGMFQIKRNHVKELRDSTEKILDAMSVEKDTYFNYDEEGTERREEHQTDWTDVEIDTSIFQTKAFHIEDLRHYLGNDFLCVFFHAIWTDREPVYGEYIHVLKSDLTLSKSIFLGTFYPKASQTAQGKYILTTESYPSGRNIGFRDKNSLSLKNTWINGDDLWHVFDRNFAWTFKHTPSYGVGYPPVVLRDPQIIHKFNALTGELISTDEIQLNSAGGLSGDKDYLYGYSDNSTRQVIEGPGGPIDVPFSGTLISNIWKYNKITKEVTIKAFDSTEVSRFSDYSTVNMLVNDNEFIYLLFSPNTREAAHEGHISEWYLKKFRKDTLEIVEPVSGATELLCSGEDATYDSPKITIDSNYIYVVDYYGLKKFNKNLVLLESNSTYNTFNVFRTPVGVLSHTAEYAAMLKSASISEVP